MPAKENKCCSANVILRFVLSSAAYLHLLPPSPLLLYLFPTNPPSTNSPSIYHLSFPLLFRCSFFLTTHPSVSFDSIFYPILSPLTLSSTFSVAFCSISPLFFFFACVFVCIYFARERNTGRPADRKWSLSGTKRKILVYLLV